MNDRPQHPGPPSEPFPPGLPNWDRPDFFSDCRQALRLSEEEIFYRRRSALEPYFVFPIIDLILTAAEVFLAIKGDKDNSEQMLKDINDKLDDMRVQIAAVNAKMDTVIQMLQNLPKVIRGEVEDVQIRTLMGEAAAKVGQIKDKVKYPDQYADALEQNADQLATLLGGISGLRGTAGVLITAPFFGAWLSATVAAQKAKKRANPQWIINSPWDRSFLKDTQKMMQSLLDDAHNQNNEFQVLARQLPNHTDAYIIFDGKFVVNNQLNEWRFSCPTPTRPETLYARRNDTWVPVTSGPAYDLWQGILLTRSEMAAFYDVLPDVYVNKDKLLASFVQPEGMWDHNN